MANDWILDVLADLKAFATKNGLSALAVQLEDAVLVAATEISALEGEGSDRAIAGWEVDNSGHSNRRTATR